VSARQPVTGEGRAARTATHTRASAAGVPAAVTTTWMQKRDRVALGTRREKLTLRARSRRSSRIRVVRVPLLSVTSHSDEASRSLPRRWLRSRATYLTTVPADVACEQPRRASPTDPGAPSLGRGE
jgi:hypothetical protein